MSLSKKVSNYNACENAQWQNQYNKKIAYQENRKGYLGTHKNQEKINIISKKPADPHKNIHAQGLLALLQIMLIYNTTSFINRPQRHVLSDSTLPITTDLTKAQPSNGDVKLRSTTISNNFLSTFSSISNFIKKHDFLVFPGAGAHTLKKKVTPPVLIERDEVEIKKNDYSCVSERADMSQAKTLRQIGKTLQQPITSLANEMHVINEYIVNRRGCQPNEQLEELNAVTQKMDMILSTITQFLPDSYAFILAQNIMGPLLIVTGDAMEGRPVDSDRIRDVSEQIVFMSKSIIDTSLSKRYQERNGENSGASSFIYTENNKFYTTMHGKKWQLITSDDLFYALCNNDIQHVIYNSFTNQWDISGRFRSFPVTGALLKRLQQRGPEDMAERGGLRAIANLYNIDHEELELFIDDHATLTPLGNGLLQKTATENTIFKSTLDTFYDKQERLFPVIEGSEIQDEARIISSLAETENDSPVKATAEQQPTALLQHAIISGASNRYAVDPGMLNTFINLKKLGLLTGGRDAFAQAHHVALEELAVYVDEAGILTPKGIDFLAEANIVPVSSRSDQTLRRELLQPAEPSTTFDKKRIPEQSSDTPTKRKKIPPPDHIEETPVRASVITHGKFFVHSDPPSANVIREPEGEYSQAQPEVINNIEYTENILGLDVTTKFDVSAIWYFYPYYDNIKRCIIEWYLRYGKDTFDENKFDLFVNRKGIYRSNTMKYIHTDGTLSELGQELLKSVNDSIRGVNIKPLRSGLGYIEIKNKDANGLLTIFLNIKQKRYKLGKTQKAAIKWFLMSNSERTGVGGIDQFVKLNDITKSNLFNYVSAKGELALAGINMMKLFTDHMALLQPKPMTFYGSNMRLTESVRFGARTAAETSLGTQLFGGTLDTKMQSLPRVEPDLPADLPMVESDIQEQERPPEILAALIKNERIESDFDKPRHRIDNSLPVLRSPEDVTMDLLYSTEGSRAVLEQKIRYLEYYLAHFNGDRQAIEHFELSKESRTYISNYGVREWWEFNDILSTIRNVTDKKNLKYRIQRDALKLLLAGNLEAHFDKLLHISTDLTDETRFRGMSVYAKEDMPVGTVIGPYAGVLYKTTTSLLESGIDHENIFNYAWRTGADKKETSWVSAFGQGNVLSLINTGQLPGKKAIGVNNVAAIKIGHNLIFYITKRDIERGEELFVNYGDSY